MTPTFPSQIAIPKEHRTDLIETLNSTLATGYDLYTQVKQAHWNIKGPHFFARHELFDKLADHLRAWNDTVAERISAIGGYAKGTARQVAEASKLDEYDLLAVDGRQHMRALVARYTTFAYSLRVGIERAKELHDPATEDLYVEILRGAEQDMWFLESHINV